MVLLLGAGGLLRESDAGTVGLTLSLPISRFRHLWVRGAVGVVEVIALSAVPAVIVPAISLLKSQWYSQQQAWLFAALWAVCGGVIFAASFLSSAIFSGEFTAPVVSLVALIAYSAIADIPAVERRMPDLHDVMSGAGMPYFNERAAVLVAPLPWSWILTLGLTTFLLMGLSVLPIGRRDF